MSESCFRPALLRSRVALITGGSSGINKAVGRRFVEHGAKVDVVAEDVGRLEAARGDCKRFGRYDVVIACVAITACSKRALQALGH